jgi:hypothetical protein
MSENKGKLKPTKKKARTAAGYQPTARTTDGPRGQEYRAGTLNLKKLQLPKFESAIQPPR